MKRSILALVLLILSLVGSVLPSTAQPNSNVQIKLTLSSKIAEVPQMIYLYGGGDRNQFFLYDSIATQPHQYEYILHGYVPYENELGLSFARKGPMKMELLAHPDEKLELTITDDEDRTGGMQYKKLGAPFWANDSLAAFWDRLYAYARKRNILTDSMSIVGLSDQKLASLRTKFDAIISERNEYQRKTALTSPSPYVSRSAAFLLWGSIPKNEYTAILDSVKRRFPDYYPLQVKKWPEMTEQSKRNQRFIQTIITKRISIQNDLQKSDSLRIGDIVDLTLIDSLGRSHQLSDYHGKFILIEMWASWCRPCVEAMPNIIHAQQMFDGQFACCAISIDKSDKSWKHAIRNYHLEALNHYKAINNDGNLHNDMRKLIVKGTIPQNYLLNKDGRIIAINIYGENLIKKLERLIAK